MLTKKDPSNFQNKEADQQPKSKPTIDQHKQIQAPKISKSRAKIFKEDLVKTITEHKTSIHRWTFGDGTTSPKVVIGAWNVNGIRSILNKKALYSYINSRKPDILCISETKIDEKSYNQAPIQLNGYHSYWNFSKHTSGYSGVVVFSKFIPIKAIEDMAQMQHSQEGRILTLEFQKFVLLNIYAPTSGKQLERLKYRQCYDIAFRKHLKALKEQYPNKPIIIAGDLNVAHTDLDTHPGKNILMSPSFTPTERKGFSELLDMGYCDIFRKMYPEVRAYTWWYVNIGGRDNETTPGLGRRIDYFLISKQKFSWVRRCEILRKVYGADHCPLELEIQIDEL